MTTVVSRITANGWKRALAEGWSVRRLKEEVDAGAQELPPSQTLDEDETTRGALLETIRDAVLRI
jgi:hypothetical protein